MTEMDAYRRHEESHLRVFRPSRGHCLDTIAQRVSDGWRLTGVQRTGRGAYILDFTRLGSSHASQLQEGEGAVVANEDALADTVVDVIAERLSSGWRLTSFRRAEQESYLVEFAREHRLQSPEETDA